MEGLGSVSAGQQWQLFGGPEAELFTALSPFSFFVGSCAVWPRCGCVLVPGAVRRRPLPWAVSLIVGGGDGWLKRCTLIAQRATGVQPHPAPESNQSDSGQVKLLKPAIIHTYPTVMFC